MSVRSAVYSSLTWSFRGASESSGALCIRYLSGILELPGFWLDMGVVHSDVAHKLCREVIRVLKDIGVDVLALGPVDESEPIVDYEGVDLLASTLLTGISRWFGVLSGEDWISQPWFDSCGHVVRLLRRRVLFLLPELFPKVLQTTSSGTPPTFLCLCDKKLSLFSSCV